MNRSLTVLLPVHNVESTISATVMEIIEDVSDWTERLELVIVDDGSADATCEVVDELVRSYPQIRTIRHGKHLGRKAAVRTGLKHSGGEIVLLRDAAHAESKAGYQVLHRRATGRVHGSSRPTRPNYLARLRNFALGE